MEVKEALRSCGLSPCIRDGDAVAESDEGISLKPWSLSVTELPSGISYASALMLAGLFMLFFILNLSQNKTIHK